MPSKRASNVADPSLPRDDPPKPVADKAASKAARIEREREKLLQRLSAHVYNDVKARTAFLLNHYPSTRNSDVDLVIRYWRIFNRELVWETGVPFENMKALTPFSSIIRARAKIQNEYKLFVAEDAVQAERSARNDAERTKQRQDRAGAPFVHIFCDESGKNHAHYVVGSVWINDRSERVYEVMRRLTAWKRTSGHDGEFHFTDVSRQKTRHYVDFVKEALVSSELLGFKAIVVPRDEVTKRSTDDALFELHYHLIVEGTHHEVKSGRFELPRRLVVFKDKEDGADALHLKNLRGRLAVECPKSFDQQVEVMGVDALDSKRHILQQLADVFTGAVSRVLNRGQDAARNHKDDLAEEILRVLGLTPSLDPSEATHDFVHIIRIGASSEATTRAQDSLAFQ